MSKIIHFIVHYIYIVGLPFCGVVEFIGRIITPHRELKLSHKARKKKYMLITIMHSIIELDTGPKDGVFSVQ